MRAFSLRNGELAVREVPRPVPESGQLLVRTLACAICTSDHHYVDHPEVAREDKSGMRVHAPESDVVMGHEFCAEIVEYGPDTQRAWPVASRVTGLPMLLSPEGQGRIIGMAPDAAGLKRRGAGPIALAGMPTQVVYECTGVDGVLAEVIDSCEIGTRIMSAGSAAADTIPSTVAHLKGIALQFGGGPQLTDWFESLELVLGGDLDPRPLIGEIVTLDQLPEAFERARSASAPIRIVYRNAVS